MKNNPFLYILLLLLGFTLPESFSQNQSILLPVPGDNSTNPSGTCQLINFSNQTSPAIDALPVHSFLVNGNPGNPRSESDLFFATPSMDEYYLGQHPMYAQNVTYDENGDILFFIIDNNIYNRYGESFVNIAEEYTAFMHDIGGVSGFNRYLTASFPPNNAMWLLSPEILVFPIPNKCFTYGLIYSFRDPSNKIDNSAKIYYREMSILNKETVSLTPTVDFIDQIMGIITAPCGNFLHLAKAITTERADGTRLLFLSWWNEMYVFSIDKDGDISILTSFAKNTNQHNWNAAVNPEMEVVEILDPATQLPTKYRLAVPMAKFSDDNGGYASLMLYEIDYNTLSVIEETRVEFPEASIMPHTHYELIKGVEYSPDGSKVFVTYYGQNDIYYYDFDQSTLNSLSLVDAEDYQYTSIERGRDGNLYFMAIDQNGGRISRLINPNNPHINNWQSGVFNTQIDELYYSYHYSDLPQNQNLYDHYSLGDKLYYKKLVFMDQIDGENSTDVFSNHWQACCHPYSASEWPSTADFNQYCNPVWIWEPGNNPFGNTTSTVTIEGTVEIPAGKKVTIQNMAFEFKENALLIVNRGGELLLDGTTMTGETPCGSIWQGIQVLGKLSEPQTSSEQGRVTLINQSLIADAITGIEAGNTNKRNSGAVIQASNSTFRNCETAIKMYPYHHTHSSGILLPNQSFISECTFVTTVDAPLTLVPEAFIDIRGITRLRIEGNTFVNERLNWTHEDTERGIGIRATDASVMVLPKCTTTSPPGCNGTPNTFEKLFIAIDHTTGLHAFATASTIKNAVFTDNYRGVWANNPTGLQIASCEFYNNYRGVYLLNSRSSSVVECSFEIADCCIPWYYGVDLLPYGIYLNEGTGFKIEENVFGRNSWSSFGINRGIIINNTGAVNNEIYKNYFPEQSPTSIAIQAQYSNKGKNEDKDVGLMLFCNQFENPSLNIKVLGKSFVAPSTPNIGINTAQGIPNPDPLEPYPLPAGNSFSPAHAVYPPFSVDLDFSNFDADYLLYFHDVSPTLRLEPDRSSLIGRRHVSQGNAPYCPSKVNPLIPIGQHYSDLVVAEIAWKASKLIRDIWVNGGLVDLGEVLETVTPWEAYHHYNELISISPYVEAEALIAMIQNPSFTDLMVKLVCVANPHASRTDAVIQALYERVPPMPESYLQEIMDQCDEYSPLEQLNAQVAIDFHASRYIIEEIKRHYRLDTVNNWVNDSLTALLGRQDGLPDQYELAQHYLITGQLNDFQTTLTNITTQFELTEQQLLDHTQFVTSMQIALEILTDSIQPGDLDSSLVADLEALLEQDGSVKSAMAVAVLKWNNRNYHYSEPILEAPDYQPRKARTSTTPQKSRSELIVYPNPARDYFTLKYLSDRKHQNLNVVVANNLGQALFTWQPQPGETEKLIDTGSLLPGAYTVLLYDGNTMLQSQKLIIIK